MVSNFNGSHFGLPPSEIHRMTGLPPQIVWTMTYAHRPHSPAALILSDSASWHSVFKSNDRTTANTNLCANNYCNNRVLRFPAIVLLTRRFDPETRAFFGYTSKLSGSKRRVNKTIAGKRRTLLLNVKPARMSVKNYCNPGNFRKRLIFVLFVSFWNLLKLIAY